SEAVPGRLPDLLRGMERRGAGDRHRGGELHARLRPRGVPPRRARRHPSRGLTMWRRTNFTVTAPAASQNLVTLPIARDELGGPPIARNGQIKRYISAASAAIATYCGRVFIAETVSEEFREDGPSTAWHGFAQYVGYPADGAAMARQGDPIVLRRLPVI